MISDINVVYQKVADKYNIDVRLVKSVGNQVYSEVKERMVKLDEAHIFLGGVGSFILKTTQVENTCRRYLKYRKYLKDTYPERVAYPIPLRIKMLFAIYLKKIIVFKKLKAETAKRQREFCKKTFESYEVKPDISLTTNKYTGNRG